MSAIWCATKVPKGTMKIAVPDRGCAQILVNQQPSGAPGIVRTGL
jgi:hypothetical protein